MGTQIGLKVIDLIAAAKSVNTIANMVEGGALESTVAEIGIEAAKDALSYVPYTEDKRSQVWSAVNHLQEAETALRTKIQTRGNRLFWMNSSGLRMAIIQRRYILGLMAICYRYLGEKALTEKTLAKIPRADEGWDRRFSQGGKGPEDFRLSNILSIPTDLFSPPGIRGGHLYEKMNIDQYKYDAGSFGRNLRASWDKGPRDLLNFRELGL